MWCFWPLIFLGFCGCGNRRCDRRCDCRRRCRENPFVDRDNADFPIMHVYHGDDPCHCGCHKEHHHDCD